MGLDVGFVGAGSIAGAHMQNLRNLPEVGVVAVSDLDQQRAAEAAEPWGASVYTDCMHMLEAERMDAVYVCLPPGSHGALEIELVNLGLPFYIEKPIHLELVVAAEVADLVQEAGLITSVGYQWRYSKAVQMAREMLADCELVLAQGSWIGGMPGTPWWRRKEQSGGQAVEQATHIYDALRFLAGEVETVYARATTGAMTDIEGFNVEDAVVALVEFSDGAVGEVANSCVLTGGGDSCVGLRLDGRDFTMKVNQGYFELSAAEEERCVSFTRPPGGWQRPADAAFIEAVKSGDDSAILSDYADGLMTLALTLAVDRSLRSGKPESPAEILLAASHGRE